MTLGTQFSLKTHNCNDYHDHDDWLVWLDQLDRPTTFVAFFMWCSKQTGELFAIKEIKQDNNEEVQQQLHAIVDSDLKQSRQ
jgi:hypothetical protein